MAYNESGEIPVSQSTYSLGGYTFELKVQNVHEPGEEEVVSVFAICRGPDGTRETQAVDFPAGTTVESWSVECNETEATVYVITKANTTATLKPGSPSAISGQAFASINDRTYMSTNAQRPVLAGTIKWSNNWTDPLLMDCILDVNNNIAQTIRTYTVDGVVFYANTGGGYSNGVINSGAFLGTFFETKDLIENLARTYFDFHYDAGNKMVGRFAIDIREADPEDWDEPGDTGDPSYTLNVYVTGASAGTHNSNNIPLDGEMQSVYGSGGNGGNGGGGGAGASTVIIYEFATDKAGSVNQEAYAREAGAGGPGGPGGRGADGCIIIFY